MPSAVLFQFLLSELIFFHSFVLPSSSALSFVRLFYQSQRFQLSNNF